MTNWPACKNILEDRRISRAISGLAKFVHLLSFRGLVKFGTWPSLGLGQNKNEGPRTKTTCFSMFFAQRPLPLYCPPPPMSNDEIGGAHFVTFFSTSSRQAAPTHLSRREACLRFPMCPLLRSAVMVIVGGAHLWTRGEGVLLSKSMRPMTCADDSTQYIQDLNEQVGVQIRSAKSSFFLASTSHGPRGLGACSGHACLPFVGRDRMRATLGMSISFATQFS